MDAQTISEQLMWEHYKNIESENYRLQQQLLTKEKEIKRLKRIVGKLNKTNKKKVSDNDNYDNYNQ